MVKFKYTIDLEGCDDVTKFDMDLTNAQLNFVKLMCKMSEAASGYGCQPTMSINPCEPKDEDCENDDEDDENA